VRSITPHLPRNVDRYGVFVDATFEEIVTTVEAAGLNGIQLYLDLDPELPLRLRAHFDNPHPLTPISIIAVLRYTDNLQQHLTETAANTPIDALLVDSNTAQARGGTGLRYDWQAAQQPFRAIAPQRRLIVAGGLNPDNVGQAIHTLHPWGVDVVSGVEAAPGRKDPARVAAFIRNARQAFAELPLLPRPAAAQDA